MDLFILLAQADGGGATSQAMEQVNAFIAAMRPETIGDILLYVVFLLALITTFTLTDGNDLAGNLLYGTMVLALFNVTVGVIWYEDPDPVYAFPAFITRVAMFLLPFIAAGAARSRKNKGKAALPLAAVTGIIGLIYNIAAFALPDLVSQVVIPY